MKLQGSAIICIECLECQKVSQKVRVYLYQENEDEAFGDEPFEWHEKQIPVGWAFEDEAEFQENENIVSGYCPAHNKELPQ